MNNKSFSKNINEDQMHENGSYLFKAKGLQSLQKMLSI